MNNEELEQKLKSLQPASLSPRLRQALATTLEHKPANVPVVRKRLWFTLVGAAVAAVVVLAVSAYLMFHDNAQVTPIANMENHPNHTINVDSGQPSASLFMVVDDIDSYSIIDLSTDTRVLSIWSKNSDEPDLPIVLMLP